MSVTEKEIMNQFETWSKIDNLITNEAKEFVNSIEDDEMVIFTGAGTSGYIGDTLVNVLNKGLPYPKFFSYFSTHIVGDGPYLINENQKVVLVSFGRSGNSPESIEAINVVNKLAKSVRHIILTCNSEGELAKYDDALVINLPDETNDKGFAMTNSFSSMTLTAYQLFKGDIEFHSLINMAREILDNFDYKKVLDCKFDNIIHLANTSSEGITSEYLLKTNELTNGRYAYYKDQVLNFRHGPKSVITKPSLIFILKSENKLARKYEEDLIKELVNDENTPKVIVLGSTDQEVYHQTNVKSLEPITNMFMHLPMLQILALKMSECLDINPDNPSPSGSVNRVVQGVTIHNL